MQPIRRLMADPHRPYTLWFVGTPSGDGLRLLIWPRASRTHAVLKHSGGYFEESFTSVEEAEAWGYRLYGALRQHDPALKGLEPAVAH